MNAESLFTDSLLYIDEGAFMNTSGLTKVALPEGCLAVGNAAFRYSADLDSVLLPSTLQVISTDAFRNDSALSYLYYDCDSAYIDFPFYESSVPFSNMPNLHPIHFGPHVRYLTGFMFKNAEGLERLTFPEGIVAIEEGCFSMECEAPKTPTPNANYAPSQEMQIPAAPVDKVVIISSGYLAGKVDTCSLRYISLPSSLEYMVGNAFDLGKYYALDTVVCRGPVPALLANIYTYLTTNYLGGAIPATSTTPVFNDSTYKVAELLVPCGSKQDYLDYEDYYYTDLWSNFQHIGEQMPYDVQLSVNIDTMGTVAWECASGGVKVTAIPAANHRFLQWSDGQTDNPRTLSLVSDTALEAQFAWGVIYTLTVGSSNTSRGTATGGGDYIQDTTVTLTATANYGYHFSQWSDGDTNNPRQYTVTANATVNASFAPNQYALDVDCDSEQGTVSGGGSYDYNTSHSISATATTGYHFTQWSDGNTQNPRSVTLTQDTAFTAEFAINVYTLTVTASEHGTVSDGGDYDHGTSVTVEASADEGYHFTQWSDGSTDNPYTFTLTGDLSLTASFAPNRYAVSVLASEGGTASASADSVDYGSSVILTATAATGHHFVAWQDGSTDNPYTVVVTADTTFTATFERNSYTVNATCDSEQGSVSGSGSYLYGDTATLTATAAPHWHFTQWNDGNKQNPRQLVVTEERTLTALFEQDLYTVTVTSDNPQQGTVSGGGKFAYGTDAVITANAKQGYHFDYWQDGNADNPRTVTVTSDTTLTAHFAADEPSDTTAIDDIYAQAGITVSVQQGCIVVLGAEGRQVRLYDAVGRRIADRRQQLPQGVYLLQVDGLPARRVVVM